MHYLRTLTALLPLLLFTPLHAAGWNVAKTADGIKVEQSSGSGYASTRATAVLEAVPAAVAAVLGGITSYFIGYLFFDALGQKIIDLYSLQDDFATVKTIFQNNAFLAVFVSTFTPLPDKVFNLAAGLFKINIPTFIFAYILGRASRFFAVGFVMKIFGARVARAVYRHLNM
ncbi:MAG TPA: VTT domain-containing protein, partial [Thiolinea sp.]|nr:VTT domain-containing protein [Thiolinea sp.]